MTAREGCPGETDTIELSLLGTPAVRRSSGDRIEVVHLPPKPLALLAYLALGESREGHRRDRLLALLWPELDDRRARGALRQALHVLRRALGPDVICNSGVDAVGLNRARLRTDAGAFLRAEEEGCWEGVVRLYGPLLDGFLVGETPEFMEWLEQMRNQYRATYARCLEGLAGRFEQREHWQNAMAWWNRLLSLDHLHMRAAVALVRCQAACGDPAGALRWAESFTTLLRNETGVDPAPQLQEAFAEGCRLARWQPVLPCRASGSPVPPERGPVGVWRMSRESAVLVLLSLALLASIVLR